MPGVLFPKQFAGSLGFPFFLASLCSIFASHTVQLSSRLHQESRRSIHNHLYCYSSFWVKMNQYFGTIWITALSRTCSRLKKMALHGSTCINIAAIKRLRALAASASFLLLKLYQDLHNFHLDSYRSSTTCEKNEDFKPSRS